MSYTPYKLKNNPREREVQEQGIKDGWNVLYKGWPDFLFYKEIDGGKIEAFCIEVKRPPYDKKIGRIFKHSNKTFDVLLSPDQEKMFKILKKLGIEVKVVYKK